MNQNHTKTYFDIAATTPLNEEVANLMHKINTDFFGNPSSIHQFGQKAHNILEKSRKRLYSISDFLKHQKTQSIATAGCRSRI